MRNPFKKKVPEAVVVEMTPKEKNIIRLFAERDETCREEAIEIYRRYIPILGAHGSTPEMNFMSEADNSVPDLALRARYREVLLDK